MRLIEYDAAELTPEEWRGGGAARAFNPTIVEVDDGYAVAYRLVQVDSDSRRIATARLDRDLVLVPGSVRPLSDEIEFAAADLPERARTWHADPVYLRLRGRLHLLWNDGGARPTNHQFLAPVSDDGQHVVAPAKELTTIDRRDIEKNWTLFEVEGEVYASYSYRPHRVVRFDLDTDEPVIVGTPAYTSDFASEYERFFGILRGGSQPVRVGDAFVTMAHSSYKLPEGRVYRGALIEFDAAPPFRVRRLSKAPFDLPSHRGSDFSHDKLNPDVHEVVYPRGLVRRGSDEWIVSYGLNDEECAIAVVSHDDLEAGFGPALRTQYTSQPGGDALRELAHPPRIAPAETPPVPVFWFDAKKKLFDGFAGGRRFTTGNFGDIASPWVAKRLSGTSTRHPLPGEPRLLAIGSVLHRAVDGDVVWGSGVKGGSDPLRRGLDLDVRAVRGPLSIEYLHDAGISTDRVTHTFDPGVLFPHMFAAELAKIEPRGGDRIVPHYHDDLFLRRRHYQHSDAFVSVDTTPLGMMRALKGADRVFASSLHGIIFAEAMGIPAYWLAPVGGEDELKYFDYYYGSGRTSVKRFESLEEAMASDPMPLPELDIEGYLATFPHDALTRLTVPALKPGQRFEFKDWGTYHLGQFVALSGFDNAQRAGVWMTSRRAAVTTAVQATPGDDIEITLAFTRANPRTFPGPQTLRAQVNGGPVRTVSWSRGEGGRVEVSLGFTATSGYTDVQIDLELEHSGYADAPRESRRALLAAKVARLVLPQRVSQLVAPDRSTQLSALRIARRAG